MTTDTTLLLRIAEIAETSPVPIAELSMDELASRLGMTRMTLYRRAGTRQEIMAALETLGIDVRQEPDVHARVVEATSRLLRERPLAEVTLEAIAAAAGCSLPAIYARFGNRQGVLRAVIERYSPLVPVREAVAAEMSDEVIDLRRDVRLLYGTVLPRLLQEWSMMRSLLAEVLRDPAGELGIALRNWYLPQVTAVLVPIFTRHMEHGTIRPLPIEIVVQSFMGPMALHAASRQVLIEVFGFQLPDIEETVDLFTDLFCRAVGTSSEG